MKILERMMMRAKGTYAAYPELSSKINFIVLLIWWLGLSAAALAASGLALYFILFLILGAILMIVCFPIGLAVFAGTGGVWAMLIAAAILVIELTGVAASIFALVSICCLRPTTSKQTLIITMISGVFHGFVVSFIYQNSDLIQNMYRSLST